MRINRTPHSINTSVIALFRRSWLSRSGRGRKKQKGNRQMKTNRIITSVLSLAMAFSAASFMQTDKASATTVDDVIAYARSVGMPEEQVQYYINMGAGGTYTSEQCDQAIGMLASYYADRDNAIGGGDSSSSDAPAVEQIEPEEFENMEVHEKKDYITQLPTEQKQEYLDLMTTEEKNQLVKEMDPTEQVGIISGMLGVGDAFGYQFAVENVSDGAIMLSARDENGTLVGVTVLGDSVEKTGYSYLVPIAACSGVILLSAAGMYLLVRKCRED